MLEFQKYHGLGNDFVVCEPPAGGLPTSEIVALCRRHRGVGADGVLLVEPVDGDPAVSMTVYNRDGSRPEMCGNGIRCVAAYARRRWDLGDDVVIDTDAGVHRCHVQSQGGARSQVSVEMGEVAVDANATPVEVAGRRFDVIVVDVGNPHAVVFERPEMSVIDEVGRRLNGDHRRFEQGVNIEFVDVEPGDEAPFRATVYERGVGRTEACGTGACAVAAAVWETGRAPVEQAVDVELPGGVITIEQRDHSLWMTGPAEWLFDGQWRPNSTSEQ